MSRMWVGFGLYCVERKEQESGSEDNSCAAAGFEWQQWIKTKPSTNHVITGIMYRGNVYCVFFIWL
jgi:hypothetical protein